MGIDQVLEAARNRLDRLEPAQAYAEQQRGALLVDTRSAAQRADDGEVPGAVVVERTVLEWRFDPACPFKLPEATGYDLRLIVLCAHGLSSSLAAASLQDMGLSRATDVIGGFEAWKAAGLPTTT
jgi:rhodanese-related sulfurtransferase